MIKNTLFLFFALFINSVNCDCVNINTTSGQTITNRTFDNDCYLHTIEHYDCCSNFLLNSQCIDSYQTCFDNKLVVINSIKNHCHQHNSSMFNLSYSDNCHNFTLELSPECCSNMSTSYCSQWYSQCYTHYNNISINCSIPTKYTNSYCGEYTKHINSNCCQDFTTMCDTIYQWCISNNPNKTSILDLFIGPFLGHTIGSNVAVYPNIQSVITCANNCIQMTQCKSFNYVNNYCYLNKHVRGDPDVTFVNNNDNSEYFEKIINMPKHNTYCNIQYPSWLGDGLCDKQGGYNTEHCNWDDGDCCQETCSSPICGLLKFDCKDPNVLNPPTSAPSNSPSYYPTGFPTTIVPSSVPTINPTPEPSHSPTIAPTSVPTNSPSNSPTDSPTDSPTESPTIKPTSQPTLTPSPEPSPSPTLNPVADPTVPPEKSKSETEENSVPSSLYVVIAILSITNAGLIYALYVLNKNQEDIKKQISSKKTNEESNSSRPRARANVSFVDNPTYRDNLDDEEENTSPLSDIDFSNNDDIYQEPDVQENNYFVVDGKEKNNDEDDTDI